MLIHLRPQPDLVKRTVEAHLMLGPLDEHDIAVTRATDAFVAYGFSRNLQWQSAAKFEGGRVTGTLTLQSMRRAGKTVGHSPGVPAQTLSGDATFERAQPGSPEPRAVALGAVSSAAQAVPELSVEAIDLVVFSVG